MFKRMEKQCWNEWLDSCFKKKLEHKTKVFSACDIIDDEEYINSQLGIIQYSLPRRAKIGIVLYGYEKLYRFFHKI